MVALTADGRADRRAAWRSGRAVVVSQSARLALCEVPSSLFLSPRKYLHNCRPRCEMRGETLRLPPFTLARAHPSNLANARLFSVISPYPTVRYPILPFPIQPNPTRLIPFFLHSSVTLPLQVGQTRYSCAHGLIKLESLFSVISLYPTVCYLTLSFPTLPKPTRLSHFLLNSSFTLPIEVG